MVVKRIAAVSLLIFGFLFSSLGCASMFNFGKHKTRFDWVAQASAPEGYPMRIIDGTFFYHNEDMGLYIPEAASVKGTWGDSTHSHNVGETYKALPDRLDVRFFSFSENKLYQGSFDLPYEKILALFKEGLANSKESPGYNSILAGIAPGGAVAVWVRGTSGTHEVFFGQAEEYNEDLYGVNGLLLTGVKRESYVQSYVKDMPPHVQEQIKTKTVPIGIWQKYRAKYRFVPVFKIPLARDYYSMAFFNGESWDDPYPVKSPDNGEKIPVPLLIAHQYKLANGNPSRGVTIHFEFEEISGVLEKLSQEGELIYIEIDPLPKESASHVRVYNSKESVWLKKYRIKQ